MQLGKKGKKRPYQILSFFLSAVLFFSVFIAVQATEMPEEGANIKNIRITGSVSLDDGNSPAGIQAELYETPFYTDTVRYSGTSASPVGSVSVSDDGTYAFEEVPKGEYSLVFSGGNGVNLQEYSIAIQESEAYSVSMKSLPVNGEENEETLICVESIFGDMDRDISLQLKKNPEETVEMTVEFTENTETMESIETTESTEIMENIETTESTETVESIETMESVETGESEEIEETLETDEIKETKEISDRARAALGDEMAAASVGLGGGVEVDHIDAGGILVNYPISFTKAPSKVVPGELVTDIQDGDGVNKTYPGYSFGNQSFDSLSLTAGTLPKGISMRYCDVASYMG